MNVNKRKSKIKSPDDMPRRKYHLVEKYILQCPSLTSFYFAVSNLLTKPEVLSTYVFSSTVSRISTRKNKAKKRKYRKRPARQVLRCKNIARKRKFKKPPAQQALGCRKIFSKCFGASAVQAIKNRNIVHVKVTRSLIFNLKDVTGFVMRFLEKWGKH